MENRKKILFVCSANQQRSPTAEALYKDDPRFAVKSAGVSRYARTPVSSELLEWADIAAVMEKRHVRIIREQFPREALNVTFILLGIPDVYEYMDPALKQELREKFEKELQQKL
jgi:protein-tyrosine phosphatase